MKRKIYKYSNYYATMAGESPCGIVTNMLDCDMVVLIY